MTWDANFRRTWLKENTHLNNQKEISGRDNNVFAYIEQRRWSYWLYNTKECVKKATNLFKTIQCMSSYFASLHYRRNHKFYERIVLVKDRSVCSATPYSTPFIFLFVSSILDLIRLHFSSNGMTWFFNFVHNRATVIINTIIV